MYVTCLAKCPSFNERVLLSATRTSSQVTFPVDFFEHNQQLTEVEFGGNDLLQVYNGQQIKHRLNSTGMYVANTKVKTSHKMMDYTNICQLCRLNNFFIHWCSWSHILSYCICMLAYTLSADTLSKLSLFDKNGCTRRQITFLITKKCHCFS